MTAVVERPGPEPRGVATRVPRFGALVAIANPELREAAVRALRALGAAEVVEAGSIAEARTRAMSTLHRELALVETTLPDGSGISLTRELRAVGWARAVALSPTADPYTVRAALAAGVRALLVTAGREPDAAVALLPVRGRSNRISGPGGLSAREVEVLQLVSDGQSNKSIGERLGLSALTVKSHLARIGRKLGTGDRAEMVVLAMRAGVVS